MNKPHETNIYSNRSENLGANLPELSKFSIRYHHLEQWLGLVRGWQGIPQDTMLGDVQDTNTSHLISPWEELDKATVEKRMKAFCHRSAVENAKAYIEHYTENSQLNGRLSSISTYLNEIERQFEEGSAEVVEVFHQFIVNLGITFGHPGITSSPEEQVAVFNLFFANDMEGYDNLIQSIIDRRTQQLAKIAEQMKDQDISKDKLARLKIYNSSLENFPKQSEKMKQFLHANDSRSELLHELAYFTHPSTRPILFFDDFCSALSSRESFLQYVEEFKNETERKVIYSEDIYGPEPDENSKILQATINKKFLSFYRFFKTALYHPDEKVIFTMEPDLICKSCRGGQTEIGEHCIVNTSGPEEDHQDGDVLTKNALIAFFKSESTSGMIKEQIEFHTDKDGEIKEIAMPIKFYFDHNLMTNLLKFCNSYRLKTIL